MGRTGIPRIALACEKAEICETNGYKFMAYVWGVIENDLYYTHTVNVRGILETPLRVISLDSISRYKVINND